MNHLSFGSKGIHGNSANMHLSVVQWFRVHRHQHHSPGQIENQITYIKNSITINFKDKGDSMYLCKAPCSVICSLTTMSQIDPVSGSSLADNERLIQEDTSVLPTSPPKPA